MQNCVAFNKLQLQNSMFLQGSTSLKCGGSVSNVQWIFSDNDLFLIVFEWIMFALSSFPKGACLELPMPQLFYSKDHHFYAWASTCQKNVSKCIDIITCVLLMKSVLFPFYCFFTVPSLLNSKIEKRWRGKMRKS